MTQETKLMIESYLRNLLGQLFAAMVIVTASTGAVSPLDFGLGDWLVVANVLWTSAIPTVIRWINSKDAAFGRVAESVALEISDRLKQMAAEAKKREAAAKKAEAKKTTTK